MHLHVSQMLQVYQIEHTPTRWLKDLQLVNLHVVHWIILAFVG